MNYPVNLENIVSYFINTLLHLTSITMDRESRALDLCGILKTTIKISAVWMVG